MAEGGALCRAREHWAISEMKNRTPQLDGRLSILLRWVFSRGFGRGRSSKMFSHLRS